MTSPCHCHSATPGITDVLSTIPVVLIIDKSYIFPKSDQMPERNAIISPILRIKRGSDWLLRNTMQLRLRLVKDSLEIMETFWSMRGLYVIIATVTSSVMRTGHRIYPSDSPSLARAIQQVRWIRIHSL